MQPEFKKIHPDLPLFRVSDGDVGIIYTPGKFIILKTHEADLLEEAFLSGLSKEEESSLHPNITSMLDQAKASADQWQSYREKPYSPSCLTIYLSNDCNLDCSYCYSKKNPASGGDSGGLIPLETAAAAAKLVAQHCQQKQETFTLVIHGGGEPTYHWSHLVSVFETVREIAYANNLPFFSYIATNGIINEKQTKWLAENFDLIGLSCDGPADIQNANRPAKNEQKTANLLVKTAQSIRDNGGEFNVRATVLPENIGRLKEIAGYIGQELGASHVRIEPVYGEGENGFRPEDADEFLQNFLDAQDEGAESGYDLSISGVRLKEIHGTYCDVFRDTLRLTSDGVATNCFYEVDGDNLRIPKNAIGSFEPSSGEFVIDQANVKAVQIKAGKIPEQCESCINIYHCSRGCPDFCPVLPEETDSSNRNQLNKFRCDLQIGLTVNWVRNMARHLTDELQSA